MAIRVVDYQKIDMNDDEYQQYQSLVKQVGEDEFRELFKTTDKGIIITISPTKPISWAVVFFIQNLSINQHMRENDARVAKLEERIKQLSKSLAEAHKSLAEVKTHTDRY